MKPAFKYAVIYRHRGKYSVGQMCRILQVSRSGYYKYVKQMQHPAKDLELAEKIRAKQESSRRTYGYRRIKLWLDSEGIVKNPKTILRIMHKYDLLSEIRRRRKWVQMGQQLRRAFSICLSSTICMTEVLLPIRPAPARQSILYWTLFILR